MVKGIGEARPLPSISLISILFSPKCPYNLISINKLTKYLNYSITFFADSVVVQDRNMGQTIGTRHESHGLYHLSDPNLLVAFTSATDILHSHLGHPSLAKFQKSVPSLSTLSSFNCESCQLGKQTRASFPKRVNNRAISMFDIVHTYI